MIPYHHAFEVNVPNNIDLEEAMDCCNYEELEDTAFGKYMKKIGFDISEQYIIEEDEIALAIGKLAQSKFANLPGVVRVIIDE